MLFNSIDFLLFFPLVVLVLWGIPAKARQIWLLICSYFFYMCWEPKYILLILGSTVVTYLSSIVYNDGVGFEPMLEIEQSFKLE